MSLPINTLLLLLLPTHPLTLLSAAAALRPPLLQTVPHLSFGRDDLVGLPRAGQAARAADAGRVSRTATLARSPETVAPPPQTFVRRALDGGHGAGKRKAREGERVRDFESEAGSPLRCSNFLLMFNCI